MDNVDKDRPADANEQTPPADAPLDEVKPLPEQAVDAVLGSETESQSGPVGGEAPTEPASEPVDASPQNVGTDKPPSWPPEEIAEEVDPRQSDILIDQGDEPLQGSVAGAEPSTEASGESKPTEESSSEAAETEETTEPAAEVDLKALTAALQQQRERLLTDLLGEERPRKAVAEPAIQAYVAAVKDAAASEIPDSDEQVKLVELARERHASALAGEQTDLEAARGAAQRNIEIYDNLFAELDALVEEAAGELARLDEEDERFKQAPEELQTTLLNFKKGVEIIHRMFDRSRARKKDLSEGLPAPLADAWPESQSAPSEDIGELVNELVQSFHKLRDESYHASQDAKKYAEKCKKAATSAITGLLSAIDGIDAGLQNEPETKAALTSFIEAEDGGSQMLAEWLQAYHRLDAAAGRFFSKTGIEAHTVEPGTPFDPETMEPQGTVANPELKDEDVAAVMRRGFSLNGEPIRPILVDVVRNA